MKWWDWVPWSSFFECWVFKTAFSLSSFTFIKRLLSSSLSAVRMVLSAYLRFLILLSWFQFVLHPAFCMMYSAYKLNEWGNNIQPWCTPFPVWNQFVVPCLVLTAASRAACRILRRQVRWSGIPISLRIFQFVVIRTIIGFTFSYIPYYLLSSGRPQALFDFSLTTL